MQELFTTMQATATSDQEMTAVMSSEDRNKEPRERSIVYFTPREEQQTELTSDTPPSYAQSSHYPTPSLSKIQTTV